MWMCSSPHTLRWVLSEADEAEKAQFYYLAKLPCDGKILLKEWYLNNWSPRALKLQGLAVIFSAKLEPTSTKYSYHYLRMDTSRSHSGAATLSELHLSLSLSLPKVSVSISCCEIISQLLYFFPLKWIKTNLLTVSISCLLKRDLKTKHKWPSGFKDFFF